jgi:hypothetical protein
MSNLLSTVHVEGVSCGSPWLPPQGGLLPPACRRVSSSPAVGEALSEAEQTRAFITQL